MAIPVSGNSVFPARIWWVLLACVMLAWMMGLKTRLFDRVVEEQDSRPQSLPNILIIVVDDLGYNDTNIINPDGAVTPNLKQLAQQGVVFSRHYADATCSPSRVAILTGMYPERSGFRTDGVEIPPEYPTIAERLKERGYVTHLTGKWHAGEERVAGWPQNKGFDSWFGFLNQWELSGAINENNKGRRRPTYLDPWLRINGGDLVPHQGHLTDILTDQTLAKIQQLNTVPRPWFIYHAFLAPHDPIQPAERYRRQRSNTPEGEYLALLDQVDDAIGRLLQAVENDENTLVIFLSDNGGTNTRRNNNYPFYGGKSETYEGSYRTPLVVHWPGRYEGGRKIGQVVMNVDLYPTLLELTGINDGVGLDGHSLVPVLEQKSPVSSGVAGRSWEQYSWNVESLSFSMLSNDARWRLSVMHGIEFGLYDLNADHSGTINVARQYPAVVKALTENYRQAHFAKSLLPVKEHKDQQGKQTIYSGFDLMRTPWQNGFAIGLEIPSLPAGETRHETLLAQQAGVWRLLYTSDGDLLWDIQGEQLVYRQFDPRRCNSLVLSGNFQPASHVARDAEQYELKMYVDASLRDKKLVRNYVRPLDQWVREPTVVNLNGKAIFSNMYVQSSDEPYEPIISPENYSRFKTARKYGELVFADVNFLNDLLCQ